MVQYRSTLLVAKYSIKVFTNHTMLCINLHVEAYSADIVKNAIILKNGKVMTCTYHAPKWLSNLRLNYSCRGLGVQCLTADRF